MLDCWSTGVDLFTPFFVLACAYFSEWRWDFNSCLFVLNWFAEDPTTWPKSVVDVGCGIGGSSRYIASKFGAKCQGITLSPIQAQRANALAAAQGLADKVNAIFLVSQTFSLPFIFWWNWLPNTYSKVWNNNFFVSW